MGNLFPKRLQRSGEIAKWDMSKSKFSIIETLKVILNATFLAFFVITSSLYGYEIIDYIVRPEAYRFGTDVAGWVYRSYLHYLGSLFALLVISLAGTLLGLFIRQQRIVMYVRSLLFFLLTSLLLYDYLSVH